MFTAIDYIKEQVPDLEYCRKLQKKMKWLKTTPKYAWYVGYDKVMLAEYDQVKAWAEADDSPCCCVPAFTASELISELINKAGDTTVTICNGRHYRTGEDGIQVLWGFKSADWCTQGHGKKLANALADVLAVIAGLGE